MSTRMPPFSGSLFRTLALPCTLALVLCAGTPAALHAQEVRVVQEKMQDNLREQSVPVRRITLYRSGVASFLRGGKVEGDAKVSLRFQTEQVNDILKSLVVLDLSGGKIGEVSYASREPLSRRLQGLGINLADNPTMGEVLTRLRGSDVNLKTAEGDARGVVINIENRATVYPAGQNGSAVQMNLPWINLLTPSGVKSYNLANITGFEILDAKLAADFKKALEAVAQQRSEQFKTVDVSLLGVGTRDVRLSYVHEAPVWKTSYRLVLPEGEGQGEDGVKSRPILQGWAIVENVTDEDWNDIELALVSGNPVSFRMDLYEPLYLKRMMLPVPVAAALRAKVFEEGQAMRQGVVAAASSPASAPAAMSMPSRQQADANVSLQRLHVRMADEMNMEMSKGASAASFSSQMLGESMLGQGQASAATTGEVFQYLVDHPVTIERQRSAMIPLVSTPIDGRRITIVTTDGSPPMRGVELTNSTRLQLMPGPIAVYDAGTYAGDAQLGDTSKGARKLIAYAMDNALAVDRETRGNETMQRFRIERGVIQITVATENTTVYTLSNKDDAQPRTVIVEHERMGGWELKSPSAYSEKTDDLYRFEVTVPAAKGSGPENAGKGTLTVTQETVNIRGVGIADVDDQTFEMYVRTGKISGAVQAAYQRMAQLRRELAAANERVERFEQERNEITLEQNRIRENIRTVDRSGEYGTRLIKKLNEQETRLERLEGELAAAREQANDAERALNDYVANLDAQ